MLFYKLINKDNFLSEIFNKNCAQVKLEDIEDKEIFDGFTFVYSKSNYSQEMSIKAKNLNFYLAEISVNFVLKKDKLNLKKFNGKFAKSANSEDVQNLAFNSFVFDRFHQDPNIPNLIASNIKKQWVKNFFRGKRGDKCFVKESKNGKIIGFLLSDFSDQFVKIDLIAVDKNYRNKGLGKSLIIDFFNFYRNHNKNFLVSTQINNFKSIRLYESVGFEKSSIQMVWHYIKKDEFY